MTRPAVEPSMPPRTAPTRTGNGRQSQRITAAAVPPDPATDRTTSASASAPVSTGNGHSRLRRIAERAHQLYEARGAQHGRSLEDWLQAEREIDAEFDSPRGTA
jgi:hypothetical protein